MNRFHVLLSRLNDVRFRMRDARATSSSSIGSVGVPFAMDGEGARGMGTQIGSRNREANLPSRMASTRSAATSELDNIFDDDVIVWQCVQ